MKGRDHYRQAYEKAREMQKKHDKSYCERPGDDDDFKKLSEQYYLYWFPPIHGIRVLWQLELLTNDEIKQEYQDYVDECDEVVELYKVEKDINFRYWLSRLLSDRTLTVRGYLATYSYLTSP